jgi:ABC-type multidrug transport system fused ATPase/permease subunit
VISHRLATVRRADRIVVLEGGRVAEQGPHETLLAWGGVYAALYEDQLARPRAVARGQGEPVPRSGLSS